MLCAHKKTGRTAGFDIQCYEGANQANILGQVNLGN